MCICLLHIIELISNTLKGIVIEISGLLKVHYSASNIILHCFKVNG